MKIVKQAVKTQALMMILIQVETEDLSEDSEASSEESGSDYNSYPVKL